MPTRIDAGLLASDLRVVIGQLVRRLRAEHRFPLHHLAVLSRLDREGTASTAELASAERVRQQSMGQTLAELGAQGMIVRRPDPDDGRRTLIELSDDGRRALAEDRRRREGWLARAIEEDFTSEEQEKLKDALALLARLTYL